MSQLINLEVRGPGATSRELQDVLSSAFADLGASAESFLASEEHGDGGISDWANPLLVYLSLPAGVVFTKYLQLSTEDSYKQMKAWTQSLFKRLSQSSRTDQIGIMFSNLRLYADDDLTDDAYRQLIDILKENPNLEADLTWGPPRGQDGVPYKGVPPRWNFSDSWH
jgi:hypothetical protein